MGKAGQRSELAPSGAPATQRNTAGAEEAESEEPSLLCLETRAAFFLPKTSQASSQPCDPKAKGKGSQGSTSTDEARFEDVPRASKPASRTQASPDSLPPLGQPQPQDKSLYAARTKTMVSSQKRQ